jgi:hypothetical protein
MKILSAAILIACVPHTPVLAEEVLHCADTNYAGFKWDKKGEASPLVTFPLHRFTIKVGPTQSYPFISDKERLITRTTEGMSRGESQLYRCTHWDQGVVCVLPFAPSNPWLFATNNGHYVRPFLAGGPPDSGFDPNIAIIYGTCTRAQSD